VKKGGLPKELARLDKLLLGGLTRTASLWPQIRTAYEWVHPAAHLLSNEEGFLSVLELRRAYRELLAQMSPHRSAEGTLSSAVTQFLKVTKSYWKGLFQCYKVAELPRTNNDLLEHYFGSARYHERRASGRKAASPALVVRGSVRIVAAPWPPERTPLRRRIYALGTPRSGKPLEVPSNVGGRPAGLSYASEETRQRTWSGSKSSYSSKLCHPSFFRDHWRRLLIILLTTVDWLTSTPAIMRRYSHLW
jgi:hypothetical protein